MGSPLQAPRGRRAVPVVLAGLLALAGGVGLLTRPRSFPTPAPTPTPAPPSSPVAAAPAAGYVGAEVCADCHEEQHAAWKQDWHARALTAATPEWVVGDWAEAHFAGSSSEAWMRQQGGAYSMRTRGPGGGVAEYPV